MPTYRDKAIVLKVQSLRDADRRYCLFTEGHGKIDLLAKGTRRGQSKMSPHLAPFGVVEVMVARGRHFDRLAGASLGRSFGGVLQSLPRTVAAQSFLLTVDALTRRELPDDRVFRLAEDFLAALDALPASDERAQLVNYAGGVVKLLDLIGFAPELQQCVRCRRDLEQDGNAADFSRGGLICPRCRDSQTWSVSANLIKTMRFLRREGFAAISALRLDSRTAAELNRVVDSLLGMHVENRFAAWEYFCRCC